MGLPYINRKHIIYAPRGETVVIMKLHFLVLLLLLYFPFFKYSDYLVSISINDYYNRSLFNSSRGDSF